MEFLNFHVYLCDELLIERSSESLIQCDIFEKSSPAGLITLEHTLDDTRSMSKLVQKSTLPAKRASPSKGPVQKAKAIKSSAPALPNQVVTTSVGGGKVDVSSMMSVTQNLATNEKSYKCSFCGFESSHVSSVTRHIETKHLPSTVMFNCRSCQYSSKFKHNLLRHYMTKHDMPEPAAQGMLACR